jgi:cytochrome c oxidase subunit II
MIEYLIPQASTYAADIDFVILLIGWITGFWFVATEGMFFFLLWRFRYREGVPAQYITGKEKHLKRWIDYPHVAIMVMDIAIIVAAVNVWYNVKQVLPEEADSERVRVVAQQWAWSFQHAGRDGVLGNEDDIYTVDELHVLKDKNYIYELEARDVMHSFSVPVWRLKQDAVPGRIITGWWNATMAGEFDLQCAEMCGIGHGIMGAKVYVHTAEEHEAWLALAEAPK